MGSSAYAKVRGRVRGRRVHTLEMVIGDSHGFNSHLKCGSEISAGHIPLDHVSICPSAEEDAVTLQHQAPHPTIHLGAIRSLSGTRG